MLRQLRSPASKPNESVSVLKRKPSEDGVKWIQRALQQMIECANQPDSWSYILLVGGSDTEAFRLRVAQAHLRRDMLPSHWSDAMLVSDVDPTLSRARITYVPLAQPTGPAFPTRHNGVVERPLRTVTRAKLFPNLALLALPVAQADIKSRLVDFQHSRATLDALEHILRWLAFAWGVARTGNPLHENYGLPSACMLETVYAAAGFDLTPGLESRASCPEAIWSAARYWHEYFATAVGRVPIGRFCTPHSFPIEEPERPNIRTVAR